MQWTILAYVSLVLRIVSCNSNNAGQGLSCLDQMPNISLAEEVVSSGGYSLTSSKQYLFTSSLVFTCSGLITGWSIVAKDGPGGARPEIGVWRSSSSGPVQSYAK